MINIGILAAILSMLVAVAGSILAKRAAKPLGTWICALMTVGIGIIPMGLGILIFGAAALPINDVALSLAAGVFLAVGFLYRYVSLRTEQVTNTIIISDIMPAIIILFSIFVFNEVLTTIQMLSIIVIFVGAGLVATTEGLKFNRKSIPAFITPVCFGIYWVLVIYSVNNSNNFLSSLFIARVAGILVILPFLIMFRRKALGKARSVITDGGMRLLSLLMLLMVLVGLINGLGDALYGVVVQYKIAAIGSGISTVGPVLTALVAYFVYRERMNRTQIVGFLAMLLGVIVLTVL